MAVITDRGRTQRAREVENALASVRMEGLEPSSEVKALFQRYVGALNTFEAEATSRRIRQLEHYAPLRVPWMRSVSGRFTTTSFRMFTYGPANFGQST